MTFSEISRWGEFFSN